MQNNTLSKNQTNQNQVKEFEEEIKFNPEFLGFFHNELLNFNTKNDSDIKLESDSLVKEDTNLTNTVNTNINKDTIEKNNTLDKINNDIKESKEKQKITENITNLDTNDFSGEINDFSKIKKMLKENHSMTSSTITIDDMKNIELDEYEMNKINEIIKYFVNIKK